MTTLLVAALAAGMVSVVNPCGFAMLPAYLGYFLGEGRQVRRVGMVAGSVAAGFLAVFIVAGALLGVGVRTVVSVIPWLALVVGLGLVVLGVSQLLGRRLVPYLRPLGHIRKSESGKGMFLFGVSYAVASLSCTLPIFLSLTTGAIASGSAVEATLTFLAYGAGMALMVVGLTVALASGRARIVDRIRPLVAHLDRISGWIMLISGGFIVWYWATILASGSVTAGSNSLVRLVDEWSAAITGFVGDRPLLILGVIGLLLVWRLRRRSSSVSRPSERQDVSVKR